MKWSDVTWHSVLWKWCVVAWNHNDSTVPAPFRGSCRVVSCRVVFHYFDPMVPGKIILRIQDAPDMTKQQCERESMQLIYSWTTRIVFYFYTPINHCKWKVPIRYILPILVSSQTNNNSNRIHSPQLIRSSLPLLLLLSVSLCLSFRVSLLSLLSFHSLLFLFLSFFFSWIIVYGTSIVQSTVPEVKDPAREIHRFFCSWYCTMVGNFLFAGEADTTHGSRWR